MDEAVAQAGVMDNGYHHIPAYPFLRSSRLLASLASTALTPEQLRTWVDMLRQLDIQSRSAELQNLGLATEPREKQLGELDRCGRALAAALLHSPGDIQTLRDNVSVPDDYSWLQRSLGAYPVAVPFLNMGIAGYHEEVRQHYSQPLDFKNSLTRLSPAVVTDAQRAAAAEQVRISQRDALGIPQLTESDWSQLEQVHAPHWLIETGGEFDRIGHPRLGTPPTVNPADATVFVQRGYGRYEGRILPQISYVAWFSERPAKSTFDSYAGALDGLIWRVTLDEQGQPLLYDTIHPCGCYHYYFPAQELKRREIGGYWQEPVLFPQDGVVPAGPLAIVVQSATHFVLRVTPAGELRADNTGPYRLAPYSDLLSLPTGTGSTRSLFDEEGFVPGTERLERYWLWPSGVSSPGAMRQWGRHATSFVGNGHFGDPDFLDALPYPRER